MRIGLTLLRGSGEPVDVAVTVDAAATVGDVARALHRRDPRGPGTEPGPVTLRVHGRPGTPDTSARLLPPTSPAAETLRAGSVVALAPPGPPAADRPPAVARLRVLAGPDAGLVADLPEGTSVIGRGAGCDVRLTDRTVSAEHARLTVADAVEIADLNSANGLLVGEEPVQRATLLPEDTVTLGATTVQVARRAASRHGPADAAVVAFNRSPRLAPVFAGEEVEAPRPPDPPRPARLPWVLLAVPLVMAPVFLLTGRSAVSLVVLAMMPLLAIGTYLDQTITARRTHRAAVEQFRTTVAAVREDLTARREAERRARLAEHPAVGDVVAAALALEPLLWTRRPEHDPFGELRLGIGTLPSRTTVTLPSRGNAVPAFWDEVVALREEFREVDGVPVTVRLREAGGLGLAGPRPVLDDVARAQVAQLVSLHSPAEVVLAAVTSAASAGRWDWLKWLPHVASPHSPLPGPHTAAGPAAAGLVARLEELLAARSAATRGAPPGPLVVLLVEDDAPVERARLVRIAEDGPAVGVHVLWCAAAVERLPAACRTFVEVRTSTEDAAAGFVRTGTAVRPLRCERLEEPAAVALARHLAAVTDAGAPVTDHADLPERVSFLTLAGPETAVSSRAIVARWQENGSLVPRDGSPPRRRRHHASLRAVLGAGAGEPFTLDLRTQGPHALVGGTTGAGKSELLQAWVLGLASSYSPDRVTFLLVDYKGGAAFAECVDLPHCVGLVTDLSPHLVRRALTSLRAEVRHREELLRRKGAKDLVSLERTGDPDSPPSLVVVVDEFATLAADVPEFVDGVVDVAQRGRSLGLHLVLATQRPAGVIRDNLRANTNLRLALRMADETDSTDVLGHPLAAHFSPDTPGRGAARIGPGRLVLFQAGSVGGRTSARAAQVEVETLTLGSGTRWDPPPAPPEDGPSDIERVVRAVRAAADAAGVPPPRRPWLPTLPAVVDLGALGPRTDAALVLGAVDDPARQRQTTACFRPDVDGNLAVLGAGGAGKSTALRTLAAAAGMATSPVHVYGLDLAGGGLAPLAVLPHVGAVVTGDDGERVQRLVRTLRALVEERSARYAAARAATITEYRNRTGRTEEPRVLVLLDGFGTFRAEWEMVPGRAQTYGDLLHVLAQGRAVGVHVAVAADRPVPAAVAAAVPCRLVLRQADESGYVQLGAPRDVLDAASPPGRAISPDGLEMQVAVLGGSAALGEQAVALERLAERLRRGGVGPAPPVGRLPEIVPGEEMPRTVDGRPVLGVADDTLAPVGFDPAGTFLLAGPPGSGRSTALRWLVHAVAAALPGARVAHLAGRRSTLGRLEVVEDSATGPTDVAELARDLLPAAARPRESGQPPLVVVVEAIADFLSGPADRPLLELIQAARRNGHLVIAEAETAAWSASWPLLAEVRNGRCGLVLQPDAIDGETIVRTPLGRVQRADFPPGRGMHVARGTARKVQVPLAP